MAKRTAKSKPSQGFIDDGAVPYEPSKAERDAAKAEEKRIMKMRNDYLNQGSGRVSTGKVRGQYRQNILSPGRAQPKGTMPRPPRTGPGSGVGGVGLGSRWSRLTGGIRFGSK